MPAQKTINPAACVRAYPTIERHRLVWMWPGDPALADPAKMPDFHWNDGSDWVGEGGTFYSLKCDYRLVIDNLMDLTHETYVHVGSIGDEAITSAPFEVTHTERTATVTRWMIDIEPPPFWAKHLGRPGRVDRWQIIYFQAPSVIVGDVGVALTQTGAPQGDRSQGMNGAFLAAITPETPRPVTTSGTSSEPSENRTHSSHAIFSAPTSMMGAACTIRITTYWKHNRRQLIETHACPSTT